jgi:NitT/TauT family transport system ATP-binding protein
MTMPGVEEALAGAGVDRAVPQIQVDGVSLAFADSGTGRPKTVLADVSVELGEREFVSLIGPSGCGKTTLLNVIAGFARPDAGRASIDGVAIDGPQDAKTAFMFARDTLLPWRTALRNVELATEVGGRRRSTERARELLARVGLADYEDYFPMQLSQGMRQRVALARTLAADRDILLMDEPFGALDAQTKVVVQAEFSRIWETERKTVIFVTHDLTEAIALSDRVIVMSAAPGRIKADYRIDLPRPRHVVDLPSDPAFHRIYRRLWDDLKPRTDGE